MIAKPIFETMFVTAIEKPKSESGLIVNIDNPMLDKQTVLAVGPNVPKDIEEGDVVKIKWDNHVVADMERSAASNIEKDLEYKKNFKIIPPYCDVEGVLCLKITPRDIDYVLKAEDLKKQASIIKTPKLVKTAGEINTKMPK